MCGIWGLSDDDQDVVGPGQAEEERSLEEKPRGRVLLGDETAPRGERRFAIAEGRIPSERFITFLVPLIERAGRKIFLIVDKLRLYHAKFVREWLEPRKDPIKVAYLPPYAPESLPTNTSTGISRPLCGRAPRAPTRHPCSRTP